MTVTSAVTICQRHTVVQLEQWTTVLLEAPKCFSCAEEKSRSLCYKGTCTTV